MDKEKNKIGVDKQKTVFTKEELCSSEKYKERRDLITALLEDGEKYSFEEVERKIKVFLKGEVN